MCLDVEYKGIFFLSKYNGYLRYTKSMKYSHREFKRLCDANASHNLFLILPPFPFLKGKGDTGEWDFYTIDITIAHLPCQSL